MLSKTKLLSGALLAGALGATLARSIQFPNDWAIAHWLLDYRFGFVKRGLPGQLLTWTTGALGLPVDPTVIAGVSFGLCVLFCALLWLLAMDILRRSGWSATTMAAMVAFLTSPFLVMTGNVVGYHDHVFLPLGIASVWLVTRGRPWAGAMLQTIALFVHESSIVIVFPVFALACLLRATDTATGQRPPSLAPLLPPLLVSLATTLLIPRTPAGFETAFAAHLAHFPFVGPAVQAYASWMLAGSLSQALALMGPRLGENLAKPSSIGLVLPTLVALLPLVLTRTRIAVVSFEALAVGAVVLLPQVLHLVAWDLERLWTYSILTMFVLVWLYAVRGPSPSTAERPLPGAFVVPFFATCANLAMETPLMGLTPDHTSRKLRAGLLFAFAIGLLALAVAQSPMPWRERLRCRGRSLAELLRRRTR